MLSRRVLSVVIGAMLAGRLTGLSAQEPSAAPSATDSQAQGYAPEAPIAAPAAAPSAAAAAPAPAMTNRQAIGAQLGFIDVMPVRSVDRIQSLLQSAAGFERDGAVELADAVAAKDKVKGMIAASKQEISTIDSKRKVAEKNKAEAEKVALEAEKKDAERGKQFLEARLDLHEAEIDRAKALQKTGTALTRALQLELELANRRLGRGQTAGVDPVGTRRQDAVIVELERKGLEAKRMQAEAQKQLADKDVDIARRRLELHKTQVTAGGQ